MTPLEELERIAKAAMQGELLPCPFCGGAPDTYLVETNNGFAVYCPRCEALGPEVWRQMEAIEEWNTRAPSPAPDVGAIAEVREAIQTALDTGFQGDLLKALAILNLVNLVTFENMPDEIYAGFDHEGKEIWISGKFILEGDRLLKYTRTPSSAYTEKRINDEYTLERIKTPAPNLDEIKRDALAAIGKKSLLSRDEEVRIKQTITYLHESGLLASQPAQPICNEAPDKLTHEKPYVREAAQPREAGAAVEVTNEMCKAGMTAFENTFGSPYTRYAAIFTAMLAAAPEREKE